MRGRIKEFGMANLEDWLHTFSRGDFKCLSIAPEHLFSRYAGSWHPLVDGSRCLLSFLLTISMNRIRRTNVSTLEIW